MSVRILGDIVTSHSVLRGGAIVVNDEGLIEAVESAPAAADFDFAGKLITPGFIDIHVHGAGGLDFMDAGTEGARSIARIHAQFGTTTLLATSWTATNKRVSNFIDSVRPVIDSPGPDEALIAGIHLEGPYICPEKRGAQPIEPIRPPDWREMTAWMAQSGAKIKVMTLAPEMAGAIEFIEKAARAGVILSLGHTNADYDRTAGAIAAGARHGTHLFNAMPALGHRAPGAVGALLEARDTRVELISDGEHIHPAMLHLAVAAKTAERVILITDAIAGAVMADGDYDLDGRTMRVRGGAARLDDGTLAGSILTMNQAFINIQKFAGVSPSAASIMSATNAAGSLGLSGVTGRIEAGLRADLAVVDPESGTVAATMRNGHWIWRA